MLTSNNLFSKTKFIGSVTVLYAVTLLLIWSAITPLIPAPQPTTFSSSSILPSEEKKFTYKKISLATGTPDTLLIPSLGINKIIEPGIYDESTQTWNVSDSGVHFAHLSSPANSNSGSTLIYGHNNKWTLGPLNKLTPGETAQIITKNNLIFTYQFRSSEDYDPANTSIFDYNGQPTLTLQTCSGAWNESRRLFTFDLIKVEKNG